MTKEQAEAETALKLVELISSAGHDDITGSGRSASCWCSDSNRSIDISDIFEAFEANYDLVPKAR